MKLYDTHLHSVVSFDSQVPRLEQALSAKSKGLAGICFTDHYDVIDADGNYVPEFNWQFAREEHKKALDANVGIELLYGLELGNATADFAAAEHALEEPNLDFVIGSTHNTTKKLGYLDYYQIKYNYDLCIEHLSDYFEQEIEIVEWGKFHSLGHLPYPLRYMKYRDGCDVSIDMYKDEVVYILEQIISKNIALEVNTKKFDENCPEYAYILDFYKELGGELITCGGDAHRVHEVGRDISNAYNLIKSKGFKYVAVYRQGKPYMNIL